MIYEEGGNINGGWRTPSFIKIGKVKSDFSFQKSPYLIELCSFSVSYFTLKNIDDRMKDGGGWDSFQRSNEYPPFRPN